MSSRTVWATNRTRVSVGKRNFIMSTISSNKLVCERRLLKEILEDHHCVDGPWDSELLPSNAFPKDQC